MRGERNTLNPILNETEVPLLPSGPLVGVSHGRSAVVYLAGAGADEWLARPPRLRERLRRSFWRYEIDMAHHWAALTLALPALEEAFLFRVWVSLTWEVSDPAEVARRRVRDLRPIIWGLLDQRLRSVSRRFGIEQAGEAEEEMTRVLERRLGDVGHGVHLGLVSVNVRLDEAAERYLISRIESRRARTLAGDDHELEKIRQEYHSDLARMRGELNRAEVVPEAELRLLRDRQEAQTENLRIELKQQRLGFYESALRAGSHGVVLLHLIENPQDVQSVLAMLREGRRDEYDQASSLLEKLLANNLMNGGDVEPVREELLKRLRSASDPRWRSVILERETSTEETRKTTQKETFIGTNS